MLPLFLLPLFLLLAPFLLLLLALFLLLLLALFLLVLLQVPLPQLGRHCCCCYCS